MDLNALSQKINNYTDIVGDWQRKVGDIYFSPTPTDVQVKLPDASGNPVATTIPNVAAYRQRLHDDVVAAQRRTIYIDEVTGSDNNDGLSKQSPMKSIEKALDKYRHLRVIWFDLLSDVNIKSSTNPIWFDAFTTVRFLSSANKSLNVVRDRNWYPIVSYAGRIELFCSSILSQQVVPNRPYGVIAVLDGASILIEGEKPTASTYDVTIDIRQNAVGFDINGGVLVAAKQNLVLGQGAFLVNPVSGSTLAFYDMKINNAKISDVQARASIFGAIRDANGTPRNFMSNRLI